MQKDIQRLREHYEQLDDERIHQLALHEVRDLTEEAVNVLTEEVRKRDLPEDLHEIISIHVQGLESPRIREIVEKIRRASCPLCSRSTRGLNMGIVRKKIGLIVFSIAVDRVILGCPSCISLKATRANVVNYLFGWWSIPWGPFRTLLAIGSNNRLRKLREDDRISEDFGLLVERNIGTIMQKDSIDDLIQEIVANPDILLTTAHRQDGLVDDPYL